MAKKSWDEHKDPYPIWGTCLGFELLALLGKFMYIWEKQKLISQNFFIYYLAANGQPNLASCKSQDQALALELTEEWDASFIGGSMPQAIKDIVTTEKVTINFHRWCLTPANFSFFHMDDFWKLLATGRDLDGLGNLFFLITYKQYN